MWRARSIAASARFAILVAIFLAPATTARTDCNPEDLWNSLVNTGEALTSPACGVAFSDPAGSGIVTALAAALGGVLAEDPNAGNQLCGDIQNAFNTLTTGGNDANTITNLLNQYFPGGASGVTSQIAGILASVASPVAAASCACAIDQGLGQLGGDIVSCLQGALCDLQAAIGDPCSCSPPPPVAANCTPPLSCTDYFSTTINTPECQNAIYGNSNPGYVPVIVTPEQNGTLITSGIGTSCAAGQYCFCPSPMTVTAVTNYNMDGGDTANGFLMYVCQCPSGTTPAGSSGPLAEVCICDNSKQPARPPDKNGVYCQLPLAGLPCPTGQVNIAGQCITPCSDVSQIRLANGACCAPSQTASCGECCPSGQSPDPATGNCTPASKLPQPRPPLQPR